MSTILEQVNNYYTQKIIAHGATPQGVDWNGEDSQNLRFAILSKIIGNDSNAEILDYGCGYGGMFEFYEKNNFNIQYSSFDVSEKMIESAIQKFGTSKADWFFTPPAKSYDYIIASGIFNVKLSSTEDEWKNYIEETLKAIDKISTKGFSFNLLTSYSDKEYMKDYLFYADPTWLFDFCKKNFSKHVALLHDYPLYEFSILVRKSI
jgi:cyclopropane fatty-acyl-phospholipid synthase-like methyltransferase